MNKTLRVLACIIARNETRFMGPTAKEGPSKGWSVNRTECHVAIKMTREWVLPPEGVCRSPNQLQARQRKEALPRGTVPGKMGF